MAKTTYQIFKEWLALPYSPTSTWKPYFFSRVLPK